jgi:NOL1/NOP2/fmu family ribosome biogenesis protein
MLRSGGRLVYSTCTFSPDENEGSVERFIKRHPNYKIIDMKRLYPHLIKGEGHFLAVLQKEGEVPLGYQGFLANGTQKGIGIKDVKEFEEFAKKSLNVKLYDDKEKPFLKFGDQLYLMMPDMPSVDKLKVLRPGLHLGTLKKNRFEPSHALALYLGKGEVRQSEELGDNANAYLGGMTISCDDNAKGWKLMTYKGYSIGWGKQAGSIIKNHYPKGLRKNI